MALKLELGTLDGVDVKYHSDYVKVGDVYRLDVDGLEDVTGLKTALQTERDLKKEAKERTKVLEAEREESERKRLEVEGNFKLLSEKDREERIKSDQNFIALQNEVATSKRDLMLRELASSLTSDALEQEIIARFAQDFVKIEGKEVSYTKELEDLKKDLAKFVRSKATGTNDTGNNNTGGTDKPQTFKEKQKALFNKK